MHAHWLKCRVGCAKLNIDVASTQLPPSFGGSLVAQQSLAVVGPVAITCSAASASYSVSFECRWLTSLCACRQSGCTLSNESAFLLRECRLTRLTGGKRRWCRCRRADCAIYCCTSNASATIRIRDRLLKNCKASYVVVRATACGRPQ